jgi:hypothetical protein
MQPSQEAKLRRFATLLVTWALLLGLFLAYDTYFVAGQREFLVEREFRTLAGLARRVTDEFDRSRLSVESALKLSNTTSRGNAKEGLCRPESTDNCHRTYIESYLKLYLNDVLVREESPSDIPDCWGRSAESERGIDQSIPVETVRESGLKLRVNCFMNQTDKPDLANKKIVFMLNLSPWIKAALEQSTDTFEDILVSDRDGNILFEKNSNGLHISNLTSMMASSSEGGAKKPGFEFFGKSIQSDAATGGATPAQKLEDLSKNTALNRVFVAGKTYLLFSHPIRVTLGSYPSNGSLDLVVSGLRQEVSLDTESRSLPYGFLIWVGLISIVLLSVSWPLFKLRFMSNTERFSPRDGWYLILALFLMSTGTVLMLLNASYISRARSAADRKTESLARKIKENFQTELKSAFAQLRGLREDASFAQVGMGPPILRGSYLTSKHLSYPYFQSAFWADCYGRQILKFDTRQAPTPSVDVSRFAFFKDAKSQIVQTNTQPEVNRVCFEVPQVLDQANNATDRLYFQPLLSPNTDEFAPTLSAPFKTELENAKKIWIQALVVRPISVVDPVLPPGFGFAVIDDQCEVLFHSDSSRNLRENFCDESKNKTELAPWLVGGANASLNITYEGRSARAYITNFPVPRLSNGGGTFLIVFQEPNRELTLNLAIVLVCSILLASYFAVLAVIAVLHLLLRGPLNLIYMPRFMWPQLKNSMSYLQLMGANVLMVVFFGIVSRQLYEASLLALSIEIAFLSIGFSIAVLACCPHTLRRWGVRAMVGSALPALVISVSHFFSWLLSRPLLFSFSVEWITLFVLPFVLGGLAVLISSKSFRAGAVQGSATAWLDQVQKHFTAAYALAALSLLACVAVVPCFGFFKYAYDAVSEISLKRDQAVLADNVQARRERIRSYYDRLATPGFTSCRINQPFDRYDTLFFSVSPVPGSAEENCEVIGSGSITPIESAPEKACVVQPAVPSNGLNEWIEKIIAKSTLTFPANEIGVEMSRLGVASTEPRDAWDRSWEELNPRCFALSGTSGSRLSDFKVTSSYLRWEGLTLGPTRYLIMFLAGLVFWLISLTRQIFLTDVQSPAPFKLVQWKSVSDINANYLVIGRTQSGKTRILRELSGLDPGDWRDLRSEIAKTIKDQNYQGPPSHTSVLILDHFEFNIRDRIWNRSRLEFLENLLYPDRSKVVEGTSLIVPTLVIVSTIDPSYFLSEEGSKILADGKDPSESTRLFDRWVRALAKFTKVSLAHSGREVFLTEVANIAELGLKHAQFAAWVCRECGSTTFLRAVGTAILRELWKTPPETREQLTEIVLDRVDTYYRVLWSGLTGSERLVLYQLAIDGWANPKNAPAIQQLERKQLICKAPMYRIMNDSFCQFVQSGEHAREISEWEKHEQESAWHAVRFILIAVLIGGGVWLLYTQAQLFQLGTGTITAIAALLTAIAGFSARLKRAPDQTDANSASS